MIVPGLNGLNPVFVEAFFIVARLKQCLHAPLNNALKLVLDNAS